MPSSGATVQHYWRRHGHTCRQRHRFDETELLLPLLLLGLETGLPEAGRTLGTLLGFFRRHHVEADRPLLTVLTATPLERRLLLAPGNLGLQQLVKRHTSLVGIGLLLLPVRVLKKEGEREEEEEEEEEEDIKR